MTKILIGTGNQAKLDMYKELLKDFDVEIVSAKELGITAPEENAKTFEEEAVKKAEYYFKKSGLPSIVDDGGFEIEALNGEPGVHSNRWIGRKMQDEEIITEVFKRMQGQANRSSKHTIVMALATPFGIFTAHSEVEGIVPDQPTQKRHDGFPYRSVLYFPNYKKYWVELSEEEEEIMNHRRHAVEKLKDVIKQLEK